MSLQPPRLLPVVIGAAALLLCVKAADLWLALAPVGEAHAQSAAPSAAAAAATPPVAGAKPASPEPSTAKPSPRDPAQYSPQELKLLQSLSQRRDQLDKRAAALDQRDVVLQAAEKRIDEKIAKLQQMQKAIDSAANKQDQEQSAKLKSLVKIYETMKPRDAARIFDQLDMPVLIEVLGNMKERSTAPILASMDPAKAKAVTLALAARNPQTQPQKP